MRTANTVLAMDDARRRAMRGEPPRAWYRGNSWYSLSSCAEVGRHEGDEVRYLSRGGTLHMAYIAGQSDTVSSRDVRNPCRSYSRRFSGHDASR
jgi:hypothetical protein